jgi:hypothetical protein
MIRELVSQLARGPETIFGLYSNRPHQDHLHLARDRRRDLARSRVLREVENQERIVLRIGAGQQVKHRRAETVNIRRRLHTSTEQLGGA